MKMIINGKKVDSESGLTFDVLNPATGEVIESVPKMCIRDRPGNHRSRSGPIDACERQIWQY